MARTYRDLISQSAMTQGIIAQGQTLTGQQASDALYILQALVDRWNSTDTMLYTQQIETKVLTSGQQVYTVGPGGNIPVTYRPTKLQSAHLRNTQVTPNTDSRMAILGAVEWSHVIAKSITTQIPYYVYYDAQYPLANLYVYPVPTASNTIVLNFYASLNADMTLDTVESLPPAYRSALYWNLAVALAPSYGLEPSPTVLQQATASVLAIQQSNFLPERMEFDLDSYGLYSINTDSFRTR
jgi:hypothetical protein